MTYDLLERSAESGQPIELYLFQLGAEEFAFTTNPEALTIAAVTYTPIAVRRDSFILDAQTRTDVLRVALPATHDLVRRYINSVPGQRATLTIRRVHRNDEDFEVVGYSRNVVRSVAFSQDGLLAEIAAMPLTGDLAKMVPRFVFSRVCNNVLFDSNCKVVAADFKHTGVASEVDGDLLEVSGLAAMGDDWATAGYVALANGDYRLILEHFADTIRILLPFPSDVTALTVDVFAGCDHKLDGDCITKFDNAINNGGYNYVPLRNPFSGDGV